MQENVKYDPSLRGKNWTLSKGSRWGLGEGQDSKKELEKQVSPNVPEQGGERVVFCPFWEREGKTLLMAKYIKMLIWHASTDKIK